MKLESQPGAVLATELKNNGAKVARWAVQSILNGSDLVKVGYVPVLNFSKQFLTKCRFVTRDNQQSNQQHVVLATQTFKTNQFALQLSLEMKSGWGVSRTHNI